MVLVHAWELDSSGFVPLCSCSARRGSVGSGQVRSGQLCCYVSSARPGREGIG